MLHSRNIPLQAINDVRDEAERRIEEGEDTHFADGVLATLQWLNGDRPAPFELPDPVIPEEAGPVPGTLTTHGVSEDEDADDEE